MPALRIDAGLLRRLETLSPVGARREFGVVPELVCTRDLLTARHLFSQLQKLDWLLAEGGTCRVDCIDLTPCHGNLRRSYNQMQYAISLLFRDCWRMVAKEGAVLVFRKIRERRPYSQTVSGLTVGVISDGSVLEQLERIFSGLREAATVPVELLVCGPAVKLSPLLAKYPEARLLPDVAHEDLRPPINLKKQRLIEAAARENLALIHDRFFFDRAWFEHLESFGNLFDFYSCRHCDIAAYPEEHRVGSDWGEMAHPTTAFSFKQTTGQVNYGETNPFYYTNGGMYVGKTSLFREVGWPGHLHWGDCEDVHFSRQIQLAGHVVQMDLQNRIFTTTKRIGRVVEANAYHKLKYRIRQFLSATRFKADHGSVLVD